MPLKCTEIDPLSLRNAFGRAPSSVVAICAHVRGERLSMVASSFVPVSLDPPLVAFCAQTESRTWSRLREADRLGISVLGESNKETVRTMSASTGDRFSGVVATESTDGAIFVHGACAWLDVAVTQEMAAGDHLVVLMEVGSLEIFDEPPLVFHRSQLETLSSPTGLCG